MDGHQKNSKTQLQIEFLAVNSIAQLFSIAPQVGEVVTTIPTIGFNVEQVTYKNLKFQVWDLGGQTSIR